MYARDFYTFRIIHLNNKELHNKMDFFFPKVSIYIF